MLRVDVVYALPAEQCLIRVELPAPATLGDAVRASGLLERYPELRAHMPLMGVFARIKAEDEPLRDGDRVELYRPLQADPKDSRRRRAADRPLRPRRHQQHRRKPSD